MKIFWIIMFAGAGCLALLAATVLLPVLIPLLFGVSLGALALLSTIFWIWMLVDCAMNEPAEGSDKIVWVIIILITHFLGAALYFFIRRPQRRALVGR